MNGLPYYKAYPRDFVEGTAGMPLELKGAYRVLLDLIYLQAGKLPDDARYISGLLGCSVRKWNAIRSELLELGKIYVNGAFLTNERVEPLTTLQLASSETRSNSAENTELET